MMAGAGEIRYLTIRPSYQNVKVDATLVSGFHRPLYVFIPQDGFYPPNAMTFGDFGARTGAVEVLEQSLQLLGELSNRIATYGIIESQRVRFGGMLFDRILAFIIKVTNDAGATVGRLLIVYWAKMAQEAEDPDLVEREDTPKKQAEIRKRERTRDVNKHLAFLLRPKNQDTKQETLERVPKDNRQYWFHRMTWPIYVHQFAAKLTSGEPSNTVGLDHKDQPVNIHNLLSIDVAVRGMQAAGASAVFCNRITYANNTLDIPSDNIWRIEPTELYWSYLCEACFPDIPRPTVDKASPEFEFHFKRFYGEQRDSKQWMVAEPGADEARLAQVAASNAHLDAEITATAKQHTVFVMESQNAQHELSNHDTFRAATEARLATEAKKAGEDPVKRAQAILRVQREQLQKFEVFIRRPPVMTDSYTAIRDYLQGYLDSHGGSFWRDIKRPAHFSNLTEFGAWVAMFPLEQEAILENYCVHRHAITVRLAAQHVYFTNAALHIWAFLTGDPKAGKSYTSRQALYFIPGTVRESQGETEKAKMESGNGGWKRYGFQIDMQEELQPSMLGLEGLHGKNLKHAKASNAMSDSASRVRHGATSHTVTWSRLVPNPSTGRFEAEHIKYTLHQTIVGAINLPAHLFPENMKSRAMLLEYVSKERANGETLTHRILFPKPEEYNNLKDATKTKMRLEQGLLAMAAMMMDLNTFQPPKLTAARGFIDEVYQLATQRGITGVSDVRHLQRITAFMEVVCVAFVQWRFYTDPKSPAKGRKHSWEHFLQQEKDFSVSIEEAAFVITLCEEQFEPLLASTTLGAIKDTFFARGRGIHAAAYHAEILLGDPADNKRATDGGKGYWCSKLYTHIVDHLQPRPPRESVINYLEELCEVQVTAPDGQRVDALRIHTDGRCQIANVLLDNVQQNRLLRCVQEVLCRKHYPRQRYVLGRLDPDAPFIWTTFSNNPDDLANDDEKKLYQELVDIAEQARRKDLGDKADDPKLRDAVLVKRYTEHEKVIWDVLIQHHGNAGAIEDAFRDSMAKRRSYVQLVDYDREDDGATEDWESRGHTTATLRSMTGDNQATLRLPSERRKAYQDEILQLARAQCKDWADPKERAKFVYPTCFASRDHKTYAAAAVQEALDDPDLFLRSHRVRARQQRLLGHPPEPPKEQKPPPDPPQQLFVPPAAEVKRSALGSLPQSTSPSRKRPREDEGRFDFLRADAPAAAPPAKKQRVEQEEEKKKKEPPQLLDLFGEIFEADAVVSTENQDLDQRAKEIAESAPEQAAAPQPESKKKRQLKKMKAMVSEEEEEDSTLPHSDDPDGGLEQLYEARAQELGYNGDIGVEVTGETEDEQPPEVDSDEGRAMLSKPSEIRREEEESLRLAEEEDAAEKAEDADSD